MTIYVITGPLGVGKTSISRLIAEKIPNTSVVEGDIFFLSLEDKDITWEDRLEASLRHILELTKENVRNGHNVVIDFATEVGTSWFIDSFSDLKVDIRYVVLVANEEILAKRLSKRGDSQYLPRSINILDRLKRDESNQKYLFDVGDVTAESAVNKIIDSEAFVLS